MACQQSSFGTKKVVSADYAGPLIPCKGRTSVVIGCQRQPNWHHRPSMASKIKDFCLLPARDTDIPQAVLGFIRSDVHLGCAFLDLFQAEKLSLASSGTVFADLAPLLFRVHIGFPKRPCAALNRTHGVHFAVSFLRVEERAVTVLVLCQRHPPPH